MGKAKAKTLHYEKTALKTKTRKAKINIEAAFYLSKKSQEKKSINR